MKIWTSMDVNKVYIMMGFHCNFHCKYCVQHNTKLEDTSVTKASDKLIKYLKRIYNTKPNNAKNKISIVFWGGEPLLYFNTIKDIISRLNGYNFKYGTVTNGYLLTQEIVDYFNKHNFMVSISNDGIYTNNTRNINVLENDKILSLIKQLNNVSINSVISAYNQDFLATSKYIKDIFKDKPVGLNWEWLMCDKDTVSDLYNIDLNKFALDTKKFFQEAKKNLISDTLTPELIFINNYLKRVHRLQIEELDLYPACSPIRRVMNIDLDGNCYACHPGAKIGDVNTPHEEMLKIYQNKFNNRFSSADCSHCEYVYICKAGCPLENICEGKIIICKAKRIFYKELLLFIKSFGGLIDD